MADENTPKPATGGAEQPAQPRLQILAQYIRDLSFENVAIQKGLKVDTKPDVQVQVALDANKRGENHYEVVNKVKVESKAGDDTLFLLELEYAGQFRIENVPDEQLHPYLMIECPRMIFPYMRRVVGDVTRDGGFPPLNIDNIDYLTLYRQEIMRRQALSKTEKPEAEKVN